MSYRPGDGFTFRIRPSPNRQDLCRVSWCCPPTSRSQPFDPQSAHARWAQTGMGSPQCSRNSDSRRASSWARRFYARLSRGKGLLSMRPSAHQTRKNSLFFKPSLFFRSHHERRWVQLSQVAVLGHISRFARSWELREAFFFLALDMAFVMHEPSVLFRVAVHRVYAVKF